MSWKEEYFKRLDVPDPTDDDIKAILEQKNINIPQYLYKYRPPKDFAINGLIKDAAWVCSPKNYTDPNEFIEKIDSLQYSKIMEAVFDNEIGLASKGKNTIPIDIIRMVKRYRRSMKFFGLFMPSSFKTKLIKVGEKVLSNLITERHRLVVEDIQTKVKVCSFCETPDNIRMWKDYAEDNTGFCIEFNIGRWSLDDIKRQLLYPVVYVDTCYNSTHHYIQQILYKRFNIMYPIISGTRKQKQYEYENEWRFIIQVGASFLEQEYYMRCQSKVYLGSAMNNDYKARIIDICKTKYIEVYQALPLSLDGIVMFENVMIT